jgi:hypothetical protein
MKSCFCKFILIILLLNLFSSGFSQIDTTVVNKLNLTLIKALYKTTFVFDKDGTIHRKDSNGNTFEFNLNDIQKIGSVFDGFDNVLIILKKGKKFKVVVNGKPGETEIIVIPFADKSDCDKVKEIMNNLIKN